MKYKAGQMVILTMGKSDWTWQYVGSIRTLRAVRQVIGGYEWYLDPPVMAMFCEGSWDECAMKPIRDQDGQDETLQWAPVPKEKVKA